MIGQYNRLYKVISKIAVNDKCKKVNSLKHCVRSQITRLKLQKSIIL